MSKGVFTARRVSRCLILHQTFTLNGTPLLIGNTRYNLRRYSLQMQDETFTLNGTPLLIANARYN